MGNKPIKEFETEIPKYIKKEYNLLSNTKCPEPMKLEEFIKASDDFAKNFSIPYFRLKTDKSDEEDDGEKYNPECKFPVETTRLKHNQESGVNLESMINSARPIIHEKLLDLLIKFLYYKKYYGTSKERKLYKNMTLLQFVDRLIKKRPVMFCNSSDSYKLLNGKRGMGGFEKIGQDKEDPNLSIVDYITYDEMKFSALISVSSSSLFFNNGRRENHGRPGSNADFEQFGVIIGQVGARFQRKFYMDYEYCAVTESQNSEERGYGPNMTSTNFMLKEWSKLWNLEYLPLWKDVLKESHDYSKVSENLFLNNKTYSERIKILAHVLLKEAQNKSKHFNKKVYLHVVGLGLGVWKLDKCQTQLYVDAFGALLNQPSWDGIGYIDFSWIPVDNCLGVKDGECFPGTSTIIHFSKRNPHDHVPEDCLLVCQFAWDGNSLPGNEYWSGSLTSTSDSASACSSCISEIHNHYINKLVSSDNLHISCCDGIIHISDYVKNKTMNM